MIGLKVLLLDSVCKYGSTGEICYNLYNYINAAGHTAAVCYGRGEQINGENLYKFASDCETVIHAGLARITGYNGCFSPISTRRLINYIEEFNPDIIHIHELHAYFVDIVPLIKYIKKKGTPVVWTFHCEYMYTGKCGHACACEKWKTGCGDCPQLKEYPKSLLFDQTGKMYGIKKKLLQDLDSIYVTPSDFYAERVKDSFLSGKQVKVIHNGINVSIYHPRERKKARDRLGISQEKTVILTVGPNIFSKSKGGTWVLELAKRQKDKSIEYVIVGDGKKIKKINDNVTMVPRIKDKDTLAEIYSGADCFVLCSDHETFSLTCAEALCCGTPVAGFRCDAPETIFASPWAEFVEYGDLNRLEETINCQICRNRTEISEYAMREFANDKMCESYMELYRFCVNKSYESK